MTHAPYLLLLNPPQTQRHLARLIVSSQENPTHFVIEINGRVIDTAGPHVPGKVGNLSHPDYSQQGIVAEAMPTIAP